MARNNTSTQAIEKHTPSQVQVRERQPEPQVQNDFTFTPPVDIQDAGQAWILTADLPGADGQTISITCEESTLTLHAPVKARWPEATFRRQEYNIGNYHRTFRIGEDIDVDQISADFKDGILMLHLPKTARAQARRIAVTTS